MNEQILEKEKIEKAFGKTVLKVSEVSKYTGMCEEEVMELISNGEIVAREFKGDWSVKSWDLACYNCPTISVNMVDKSANQRYTGLLQVEENEIGEEEYQEMVKRANGNGSVFFNNIRGVWQGAVSCGYDESGKRVRKIVSGSDKAEVLEKINQLLLKDSEEVCKMKEEDVVKKEVSVVFLKEMKFREYIAKKLEEGGFSDTTGECYISNIKHINKKIGDMKMGDITESVCKTFINGFTKEKYGKGIYYSQNVIHKVYVLLGVITKEAAKEKLIDADFMEYIKEPPSKAKPIPKRKAFSEEEVEQLLDTIKDDLKINALIRLQRDTGMRPGEALAINFSDIKPVKIKENKDVHIVEIRKALVKKFKLDYKTQKVKVIGAEIAPLKNSNKGKNESAYRDLPISEETFQAIRRYKEEIEKNKKVIKRKKEIGHEDLIFTDDKGNVVPQDHYYRRYAKIIKKKGLKTSQFQCYRLRHTFITGVANRVQLVLASKMAGHSNVEMTKKYVTVEKEQIIEESSKYLESLKKENDDNDMAIAV